MSRRDDRRSAEGARCARAVPSILSAAFVMGADAPGVELLTAWQVLSAARSGERALIEPFAVADSACATALGSGLVLAGGYSFTDAPSPDLVIVGSRTLTAAGAAWLADASAGARTVVGLGPGVFALAEHGMLGGHPVSVHQDHADTLTSLYPNVRALRSTDFLDFGTVASAVGLNATTELALHLIERFFGEDASEATALALGHW